MNYSSIINKSIEKVYQNGIATKILQHMDRIRNVSDLGQARRWIMELLQNSRDTAYADRAVRIRVALDQDRLVFQHNGMPFWTKDILFIVNQVSSKSPGENTVGQFGTGFMTTYQLSEIVEIQSVLKDEGLPYKPFSVKIDRRGVQKEEILAGIFQTMEELKKADEQEELNHFDRSAFNTRFIYHLEENYNYKIAKTGMDDLRKAWHHSGSGCQDCGRYVKKCGKQICIPDCVAEWECWPPGCWMREAALFHCSGFQNVRSSKLLTFWNIMHLIRKKHLHLISHFIDDSCLHGNICCIIRVAFRHGIYGIKMLLFLHGQ